MRALSANACGHSARAMTTAPRTAVAPKKDGDDDDEGDVDDHNDKDVRV